MAKKLSEQVENILVVFKGAVSNDAAFTKMVNDTASMLGRQQVTTVDGEWKTGANFKLSAKDTHKVQLPPNSPCTILFYFGLRLKEITTAGEFVVNASIPKAAQAYVDQCIKNPGVPAETQEAQLEMTLQRQPIYGVTLHFDRLFFESL